MSRSNGGHSRKVQPDRAAKEPLIELAILVKGSLHSGAPAQRLRESEEPVLSNHFGCFNKIQAKAGAEVRL